ncbi:MAG: Gfo/Idh/MocA family oxidoreductase [Planctomycetes bacterium]|nr:Gfo/Idh/MocA family oxidoreductase [Planctomycetota bacterium]
MSTCERTPRRDFLKRGASLGLPFLVSGSALGRGSAPPPSDRILMGAIGVGNRCAVVLPDFLKRSEVLMAALCDVRKNLLLQRARQVDEHYGRKVAATYTDFRELLARDDIDAVYLATPTHWHVPIALEAVRRGKHLYMEKPVGLGVEQAQILREAVEEKKPVFQLGLQQRSSKAFRFACELVRNGRIGKVLRIEVGVPGGSETPSFPEMPIPDWLDFDRWLGPAPLRPFTENILQTSYHERISDFVPGGFMNAWGIHHLDIAQWGNGTEHTGPTEVEGTATYPKAGLVDTPITWDVDLRFAGGVTVSFADTSKNRFGILFKGEKGTVYINRGAFETQPESLAKEMIGDREIRLPGHDQEHESHAWNFVDCLRSRRQTLAPIGIGVRSDTLCQLSDIAVRLGRKLTWNPRTERFVGDATANRLLTSYPLRNPWKL